MASHHRDMRNPATGTGTRANRSTSISNSSQSHSNYPHGHAHPSRFPQATSQSQTQLHQQASAAAMHTVRRNIFQQRTTRRTAAASGMPTNGASDSHQSRSTSPLGIPVSNRSVSVTSGEGGLHSGLMASDSSNSFDNGDLVARDKNGGYKVDMPILPAHLWEEDGGEGMEMDGIEMNRSRQETEASLVEMVCRQRNQRLNNDPSGILLLIKQSLRNKVAALDDDNWMYEIEDPVGI